MSAQAMCSKLPNTASAHRSRRVLVVDDDHHMRELVAATVRGAGYAVIEARDGIEVLDRFVSTIWGERPDLFGAIVSDVDMPGPTGHDLLVMLRSWGCDTPIILLTAFGSVESRAEAT